MKYKKQVFIDKDGKYYRWVFTPYVTRNGRKVFPKRKKVFKFPVEVDCPCEWE